MTRHGSKGANLSGRVTQVSSARAGPSAADPTSRTETPVAANDWAARFLQEILTITYWLDPGDRGEPFAAMIRFEGRRGGVNGKLGPRDRFSRVETVEGLLPGSGPVSVTTRVSGVDPGQWRVTAVPVFHKGTPPVRAYDPSDRAARASPSVPWPWVQPRILTAGGRSVKTALIPFAPVPGVIPGAWGALVIAGVLIGFWIQALVLARAQPDVGQSLAVSLSALTAGLIGAQLWFFGLHRGQGPGWCIQGFVLGLTVIGAFALFATGIPVGQYLDAAAPGLFLGMAIGRPGCFLAGCCAGKPTASRWGLWASDQRIGARRIPTQLFESLVALSIGLLALILVRQSVAGAGAVFVGGVAAYTLGRQILRPYRAEPLRYSIQRPLTIIAAALVLVGAVLWSAVA